MKENRILVAADEVSLLEDVLKALKRDGYAATTTSCGEEAWEIFFRNPYLLVIADLVMKNMSELDLLQKIKQYRPDTQFVIMTSHASIDSVTTSLRCGAFDYLSKPFDDFNFSMNSVKTVPG